MEGIISNVHPTLIPLRRKPWARDVMRQRERLIREGQIEPILLTWRGYADLTWFAYAEALIQAAIELGWNSVLVTTDDGDEQEIDIATCQSCGAYWDGALYTRCARCGGDLG